MLSPGPITEVANLLKMVGTLGILHAGFHCMIAIVQANADQLGGAGDRRQKLGLSQRDASAAGARATGSVEPLLAGGNQGDYVRIACAAESNNSSSYNYAGFGRLPGLLERNNTHCGG